MRFGILVLFSSIFVLSLMSIASAEVLYCAEKTKEGGICQMVSRDEVNESYDYAPIVCRETAFCKLGTCVNREDGTCTPNTNKATCEIRDRGLWYDQAKEDVAACRPGCCIMGQEVAFVNSAICKSIGSDHGVDIIFRRDVRTQSECFALEETPYEGACVFPQDEEGTRCERTTRGECVQKGGEVFHEGLLCTAGDLSDCGPDRTRTRIHRDKVYFVDTCGNLANVYDENKIADFDDYWTYIQDPDCGPVGSASETCGDCSYRRGTIAAEYDAGEYGMPDNPPENGTNVCREIGCEYIDPWTETIQEFQHGESWCAHMPGTYYNENHEWEDGKEGRGLPLNLTEVKEDLKSDYVRIEGGLPTPDYNLPGSVYVQLSCYDGEIYHEKCGDFARNSVCMEGYNDARGKREAACFPNPAARCLENLNKASCEENMFCKWIPGYAVSGLFIGHGLDEMEEELGLIYEDNIERYDDLQGQCYPLISPGTDFWTAEGQEQCSDMGGIPGEGIENVLYETGIWDFQTRASFAEDDVQSAAERCIDNCWAIPGYGGDYDRASREFTYRSLNVLKSYQLVTGERPPADILTRREGYHCLNKPGPDQIDNWDTGREWRTTVGCDLNERRVKQFYTHEQWLTAIAERARSIGDCGYKPHAYDGETIGGKPFNWEGDSQTERIVVSFEILDQEGEVKNIVGEKTILYYGGDINDGVPIRGSGYRNW